MDFRHLPDPSGSYWGSDWLVLSSIYWFGWSGFFWFGWSLIKGSLALGRRWKVGSSLPSRRSEETELLSMIVKPNYMLVISLCLMCFVCKHCNAERRSNAVILIWLFLKMVGEACYHEKVPSRVGENGWWRLFYRGKSGTFVHSVVTFPLLALMEINLHLWNHKISNVVREGCKKRRPF